MTSTDQFLAKLRRLGLEIWSEDGQLRYRGPKAIVTAELVAEMAARKHDLLEFLRSANQSIRHVAPPIRPVPRDGELPLSFAQQRMWFLARFEPDSTAYIETSAYRIGGIFDQPALERALNEIVRRHEILRTVYPSLDGQPSQIILNSLEIPLHVVDLSALPEHEREMEAQRCIREDKLIAMDLASGPLLRTTLLRCAPSHHVLIITMHHIITDAWSNNVFTRELVVLYRTFAGGEHSPLQELPFQYADFAAWQHQWIQGEILEHQLGYWKKQLANPPLLILPIDHSPSTDYAFHTAEVPFSLTPTQVEHLREIGQQEGCTLFMTLLAAFKLLLFRYTGQSDIVMGTEIANRNHHGLENLVGFFINQLVIRTDLSGDITFRDLLRRVRNVTLQAYAHQDLPFEKLVEELQPERNMSKQPLFQAGLSLEPRREALPTFADLNLCEIKLEYGALFDLNLFLTEDINGIGGALIYNCELFEAPKMERLLGHYHTILQAISDPDLRLSQFPILTAAEFDQLASWNTTVVESDDTLNLLALFEQQVRRAPETCAVILNDQELSYSELERRINQLTNYLVTHGIADEKLVGICLEPCIERVISLFAILKAGGVAVAIDPSYPEDRLKLMLESPNLALLLTTRELLLELPPVHIPAFLFDGDSGALEEQPSWAQASAGHPDNLQYVIFTSGSTGIPKQIGFTQRAFLNLLCWQQRDSGLAPVAKTLQFSTFGFCVSYQEIFTTLCGGGTLVIVPEEARRDPTRLLDILCAQQVERLYLPFAALKLLAETAIQQGRIPASLKEVVTAGEPLQLTGVLRDFFRQIDQSTLHNQYGASETHVVSALTLEGSVDEWPDLPCVGRAIANCELYILDRHLQPLPVGIPGELFIGGACLMSGYLNDPELTATKLLPHPNFPGYAGASARLYRTGDLAVYHDDGTLRVLGRVDQQIKIRGFRIELGEIEQAIRDYAPVQDVVVVPEELDYEHKRLLAYVVLRKETSNTISELRAFLKKRLPDHMVPTFFVSISSLPQNANGKLDYQALPKPDYSRPELVASYVAPRSDLEMELAAIWQTVLKVDRISVYDSFFDLGGHSLLATQVIARVHDQFGVELPLRSLFRSATIAEFVLEIVEQQAAQMSQDDMDVLIAELDQLGMPTAHPQQAEDQPHSYDIVVVGSRCAGAATAMLLARKGYRVLMVDRANFPSDTISTHLIWPIGIAHLKRWGLLEALEALNCPPIQQVLSDMGDFPLIGSLPAIDGVSTAYCPRRSGLDQLLIQSAIQAGVEFWEDCLVQELIRDNNRVVGITGRRVNQQAFSVYASIVVGADGRNSTIARLVDAPLYYDIAPQACYYYAYWNGVGLDKMEIYRRGRRLITAIPSTNGQAVVLTAWPHAELEQYKSDLEGNYRRTLELVPELATRVLAGEREGKIIGMAHLPNFFRQPFGAGWALVGDAGYHKDPYMAHGISDAFRDAELLTNAIDAALTQQLPLGQALSAYESARNAAALPLYRLTCEAAALEAPSAEQLGFREFIRNDQDAIDQLIGVMAGTVPVNHVIDSQSVAG
jgi:surfactin family lipopeptide synthetase A